MEKTMNYKKITIIASLLSLSFLTACTLKVHDHDHGKHRGWYKRDKGNHVYINNRPDKVIVHVDDDRHHKKHKGKGRSHRD